MSTDDDGTDLDPALFGEADGYTIAEHPRFGHLIEDGPTCGTCGQIVGPDEDKATGTHGGPVHARCVPAPAAPTAADVARQLSEDARTLNHATLPATGFPGLEWPADAYETLGALAEAVRRLPQATGQIARFLEKQASREGLYDAEGREPAERVGVARATLAAAGRLLEQAAGYLDAAQRATSGLAGDTGDVGEDGAR